MIEMSRRLLPALLLLATPAFAQPPAETCGVGDSLSSSDMMPVNVSATPLTDDFDMTGAGCDDRIADHVTCFTPTGSCVVDASCAVVIPLRGLQVSVNAFAGPCTTSPASCLDSGVGTGSGTITSLALTGGTNYCFVCELGNATEEVSLAINEISGSCGALPVSLQRFDIE